MDKIYCLFVDGGSLKEEMLSQLFALSQQMINRKDRRLRLTKISHGVEGELTTAYKVGFMGTICGIIFVAYMDTEKVTLKTSFIVRQIEKNKNGIFSRQWV